MNHSAKSLLLGTVGAAGLLLATSATASADTTHTVAKNDTVWDLSQKYGVSIADIEKANNVDTNTHLILVGQTLKIPTTATTNSQASTANTTEVTVKSGDTLWGIAQAYGISVDQLRSLNGLATDAFIIRPGDVLKTTGQLQTQTSTATQTTVATENTTQNTTPTQETTTETQDAQTQTPVIAANHVSYTVKEGDSLYIIAQAYGVTVDSLRQSNTLGATLQIGQTLIINNPTKTPTTTTQGTQTSTSQSTSSSQSSQNNQTTNSSTQTSTSGTTSSSNTSSSTSSNTGASSSTTTQTPSSSTSSYSGAAIAQYASTFIGVPYVWGGTTPSGFDCSGLTQYVYAHFGKSIGRNTIAQENAGTIIPVSQAQVGDLLFWGSRGSTYHVGIYMGGSTYLAAPEPGRSVSTGNMNYFMPSFAVHVN